MTASGLFGVQPTKRARVLLVDDDADARDLLSELVAAMGHEVATACDGLDALDRIQQSIPDVIVLDWMMPRMNGAELLTLLRADSRLSSVPVIVASAVADLVRPHGAAALMLKPCDPFDLAAIIGALAEQTAVTA